MIHECIQRLEPENNVIRSYARELRQRADNIFELEVVRYFLEALGDAAIRVQGVRQQHQCMTIERAGYRNSIRHLGK
jgi:hypothetical protein